jgi:hypothetical protein
MRLGLQDIDSQIAEAILERLAAPTSTFLKEDIHWAGWNPLNMKWEFRATGLKITRKRDPNEDERQAYELRRKRDNEVAGRAAGTGVLSAGLGAVALATGSGLHLQGAILGLCCVGVAAATSVVGGMWTMRALPTNRLRRGVRLEEFRAVFPLLKLTRSERIYCDTLLMLARTDATPETELSLREGLAQLNQLVLADRQLEQRRQSLLPLLGNNVIPELETEFGLLGRRLDAAVDPMTRQSLEQSLKMCQTRLENARALREGFTRLQAQQEAIAHTISTAQSSMARLQLAPQPQTQFMAQEIAETEAQMNQQTYAVEQAVQEVMTLRQ